MTRAFAAYAPPLSWGAPLEIASHLGSITYTITYSAVGSTLVVGQVSYFKPGNEEKVTESIASGGSITTDNVVANVEISFKGTPTGSAVNGTINP